jgi:hypothetical protein
MGQLRRWGARDPRRVIAWFAGTSLVSVCVFVVAAMADHIPLLLGSGIALVDLVIEGAIFLPRAWRASREGLSPSN